MPRPRKGDQVWWAGTPMTFDRIDSDDFEIAVLLDEDGREWPVDLENVETTTYVEHFDRVVGSCRDMFEGAPRDERGLPDPLDETAPFELEPTEPQS